MVETACPRERLPIDCELLDEWKKLEKFRKVVFRKEAFIKRSPSQRLLATALEISWKPYVYETGPDRWMDGRSTHDHMSVGEEKERDHDDSMFDV